MNDKLYIATISLAVLCTLSLSSAEPLQDEKANGYYQSVFTEGIEPTLNAIETKRSLWGIDNALIGKTDEKSLLARRQVRTLLDATVINRDMCMRGVFVQINRLIQENAQFPNIVEYLKHQKRDLFDTCQSTFVRSLRQDVRDLNRKDTKQLGLLRSSIIRANDGKEIGKPDFNIPKQVLLEGVLAFISNKLGRPNDKLRNKDVFREEFEKHVGNLCGSVKRNLSTSIQIYEALVTDKEVVDRFDAFEVGWIADVKVCNTILANINSICPKIHDMWLKKIGSK